MNDRDSLASGIVAGRYRALAKAISLVERDDPDSERLLAVGSRLRPLCEVELGAARFVRGRFCFASRITS